MTIISVATFFECCVPAPRLDYIGRDRLGVLTGDAYDNAMYAGAIGKGRQITRLSGSLRGSSGLVAKSEKSALLDLLLKTNSYVREIRCYYPLVVEGRDLPMVVERMVTVERKVTPGKAHLHAVTCSLQDFRKFRVRLEREGVTSEVFDSNSISSLTVQNASFMYGIARSMNILEPRTREEAGQLAHRLYESVRRRERLGALKEEQRYRQCTLDRLMQRLARREGISLDQAYALFGVGLILGFICVPPDHELNPKIPLRLAPPLVRCC